MKRTIKHSIRYLLGTVLLLGVSCIRDEYPTRAGVSDDGREVTVELRLQTADGLFGRARSETRSETYDRERTVADALVLFFRGSGKDATLYAVAEGQNLSDGSQRGTPGGLSATVTTGTVTFQANFTVEAQYAGDNFTCVVLTNVQGVTLAGGSTSVLKALQGAVGESCQQIQSQLVQTVGGALLTAPDEYIPMYGRATSLLIPSTAPTQRLSVPLIRSLARVQLYNAATADFTLTEAFVFRATDRMALLPLATAFDGSASPNVVTKPSIPSGAAALAGSAPWRYTVSDNRSEGEIYLPEADTHLGKADAAPGDTDHTKRCAMVVGGSYRGGATSYYRIDFTSTAEDTRTLLDVLRNHSYNITISAVKSAGASSPEEAYNSQSTNIDASVIEWTDENQEMVFDGTNWFSVNRKRVEFADGADLEVLLPAKSNVKPSMWTMQLEDGSSMQEPGQPTADATVRGAYFSVTKPEDSSDDAPCQGGSLVIRTLQANPSEEQGGAVRVERLHVYVGRLELIVELVQNPYEDTPWGDGGSVEGGL